MQRLVEGFRLNGRYVLGERIASGGMADVWQGQDDVLGRTVAVKVMRPVADDEELYAARFRDEARHSAGLLHPNIVTVFDFGEDDRLRFIVMELIAGRPLSKIVREDGRLSADEVRLATAQCALALGFAHQAHVVHRDVKPANILMREDGLTKLTDFGIARALEGSGHTRHGEMLGTPDYISPEQALGQSATGASDLYSLGVVAHEMLTGNRPFDRGTPIATALSHVNEPPPPLGEDVPKDLRDIVAAMLEKRPEDRPRNAREVAVALGATEGDLVGLSDEGATDLADPPQVATVTHDDVPTMAARPEDLLEG